MASASRNHGDGDHDNAPPSPPREYDTVLSPVTNIQRQSPIDNTGDPRDGHETSLSSDEGEGVQILTERQLEKHPQSTQEIPVGRAQLPPPITREDLADLLAALRSTNETLQLQGLRITALEESLRSKRSGSALLDKLDRSRKHLLLADRTLTISVLLWNDFNNRVKNATALLPARIGSPRQK
ncbi:hypothetical protein A2U01_0042803, partial [Trifolium medium]|nr:hypothetical protein [Trifolium medium]